LKSVAAKKEEAEFVCPTDATRHPLIETRDALLVDELVLITMNGLRMRFDLLAGQLESARDECSTLAQMHQSIEPR
jgi:hypothetical protein